MTYPGTKPQLSRSGAHKGVVSRERAVRQAGNGPKKTTDMKRASLNLRAVAEVLTEYGLNPAEEVVKALQSGKLDAKTQASIGLALIEYLQPKLKAVEYKGEVKVDPEQLDRQLAALLAKAKA